MIAVSKAAAAHLVANAGAVIDKAGLAHPVLGYVVIEPTGPETVTVRAVGQAAHAAWEVEVDHDLTTPLAIQHAHLAKLQALMPAGTLLRFLPGSGTVRIELARAESVLGSWDVPIASASTLAYFPPEPFPEPGGDPETFTSVDLADALAQLAWLTSDDTTVQIIDGTIVLASSWSAAHKVVMPHRPARASVVTIVPGRAAKVLRTALPRDRGAAVTWLTDEHFHHLTYRGARLHLAKWSGAVENVLARFFPPTNSPDVTVASSRLSGCVARASALSDAVDMATAKDPGALVVSASDGSSTQTAEAEVPGSGWLAPVRFQAAQLTPALEAFNGERIHIESGTTGTVIFSEPDGTQAVSLVPLASVVL